MTDPRRTRLAVLVGLLAGVALVPLVALAVTGPAVIDAGTAFNATSGPTVILDESAAVDASQPFPDSQTVALGVGELSGGTLTANVSGVESNDPRTTAADMTGSGVTLARTDAPISVASTGGNITQLGVIGSNAYGDGAGDIVAYGGAGGGEIAIRGLTNTPGTVGIVNTATGLAVANTGVSGGTATLSVPAGAQWTLSIESPAPEIGQGNPDGATVPVGQSLNLSVPVSHPNMASETVTVEFVELTGTGLDTSRGETIGQTSISANGTVALNWTSGPSAQTTGWVVDATASNGQTASRSFDLSPDTTPPVIQNVSQSKNIVAIRNDITLNATVGHPDFPDEQVDVRLIRYRTGDPAEDPEIGNGTLSANGTVSTTTQVNIGPQFRWYVVAVDNGGETAVSSVQTAQVEGPGYGTPPEVSPGPGRLLGGEGWIDMLLLPFVALLGETLFATILGGSLITGFWIYSGNVAFPAILVLLLGGVLLTTTAGPVAQAAQALVVIGLASTLLALARRYVL